MDFLVPIVRSLHVIAAGIWFGAGLYAWLLLRAESAGESAVNARYHAQIYRVSKLGLLLPIAAMATALFGLLSYGMMRYWTIGVFTDIGTIIFHVGVLLGIGATGHGAATFGKSDKRIKALTADSVNPDGTINADTLQSLSAALSKYSDMLNIHVALVVASFICMALGVSL